MSSLDELFEGGSDDDRPMASRSDGEPTPFDRFRNMEDRPRIAAACWNWIRCTARCWCSGSTKSCRLKRLPR